MSNEPLLLGGISDDFTGGLELASMMARDGLRTRLLTRLARADDLADLDVAVIALKSRVAPAAKAVRDVAKAADLLAKRGVRQVFFKYCATFNSTPRGNIGPCADYLADRLGADFTGFCPAFPDVERKVYRGHLFWADQLISELAEAVRSADADARSQSGAGAAGADQRQGRIDPARRSAGRSGFASGARERTQAAGVRYAICDADQQ